MTTGEPLVRWDWVQSHASEIASRVGEHAELTAIAVGFGLAIAFALALVALRLPLSYGPITWVTGILYTIPSLALFAALVPYTGLSVLTAEVGLISYTLLILVRNIVSGVRGVPEEVRDAAEGMGYTDRQILWRVELPLALAVIIAGIRVATITTIGLVTVTAVIGLGGFGYFILLGMQQLFSTPLLVGAVGSIAFAIVSDTALVLVQGMLTPWARAR